MAAMGLADSRVGWPDCGAVGEATCNYAGVKVADRHFEPVVTGRYLAKP